MSTIKFDDEAAKTALRKLHAEAEPWRKEIIVHTQFRRNVAVSPLDPTWGQPNPIDISGLISNAFLAGIRHANEVLAERGKASP